MADTRFDIVAMGDAIVDVIAACDDDFLEEYGLPRGSMQLLSPEAADALYDAMGQARETSGGSAANSMAGIAAMGGRAAFIGQVAEDQLGMIFEHDLKSLGVYFDTPPLIGGPPTGRCLILVTPDGQRTMNTAPGASHELVAETISETLIRDSAILYLEGYLFGPDKPRAAMKKAVEIAHNAGREVAFTLSESVCITERADRFTRFIESGSVDLLFCNEDEAIMLTGEADLEAAIASLRPMVPTLVITRGEHGALVDSQGERVEVPAAPVDKVVDTTGAGDMFAAGFLAARARGLDAKTCLEKGALAAAEVIQHYGARPEGNLKEKVGL
ncbi:adenosine kinase [Sphingomicrobium clamense]|uniref:Adenosine kinase n=1 Tax=Sphingomicrobium clamense TaxID=2851013 RepID=A0ABS6V744_9SPHN|nr:adenosine kinase [Sphingomicrobium sp. B8]MBW0145390.1 adenosine kinase [Sphingomicrobium sp. B8]